jgi:UDP-arabinose 4-epimerase
MTIFRKGHRWAVKWGPLVEADLSDRHALKQAIQQHNVGAAIHFAAHAYVGESVYEPAATFTTTLPIRSTF